MFGTKIDQAEQEIKEKLDRSASKLDRPTSEMPGMHQPSAFSTNILESKYIVCFIFPWGLFPLQSDLSLPCDPWPRI